MSSSRPPTSANPALLPVIGWREWVSLPGLGIPGVKAKVDSGARTSCLHAFRLEPVDDGPEPAVRFSIHPLQRRTDVEVQCRAPVLTRRVVRDSGGHVEDRYVIRTPLRIGEREWDIEVTLTSRDDMLFRMLIGRTAIRDRYVVDTARSHLAGDRKLRKAYGPKPRIHTKAPL